ncbi:MAG: hypothetical protein ABIJ34_07265 [archaeon]
MIRKVSKVGQSSLVVSLPFEWVRHYKIKKGDDINLTPKGKSLIISTSNESDGDDITINLDNKNTGLLWRYFMGAYARGFKTIKVVFSQENIVVTDKIFRKRGYKTINPMELVNESVKTMIGMEIVEQRAGTCTIKQLANISEDEFNATLRRMFLIVKGMLEDILKTPEDKMILLTNNLLLVDETINKFTLFCNRIIAKKDLSNTTNVELYYSIVNGIERIGDEVKDIPKLLLKNDQRCTAIVQSLTDLFTDFYKNFYEYDDKLADKVLQKSIDIKRSSDKLVESSSEDWLSLFAGKIRNITGLIRYHTEEMIQLHLSK